MYNLIPKLLFACVKQFENVTFDLQVSMQLFWALSVH